MSTFDGNNLFGSGPHRIIVDGEIVMKKRTGYAGVNGLESVTIGGRGRPVQIIGQLEAPTRHETGGTDGVDDLISDIEAVIRDTGAADLIDHESGTYSNVELDNFRMMGGYNYATGKCIVRYVVTGHQIR